MRSLGKWVVLVVLAAVLVGGPVMHVGAAEHSAVGVAQWQDGGQRPTVVVEDQNNFDPLWVIIGVVAGALIGVPVGLGGGVLLLRRLNDSVPFKDALEHLAMSVPRESFKEVIQEVNKGAQGLQDIFKFFMSQYAYPNTPGARTALLKQLAELGYQGATLVESVTDGEANAPLAPTG